MYIQLHRIVTVYIHVQTCLEHKTRKKAVKLQHRHWWCWETVKLEMYCGRLCGPYQLVVFHSNIQHVVSKILWFILAHSFLHTAYVQIEMKVFVFFTCGYGFEWKVRQKILAFSHTFKPAPKPHEADFLQVQVHSPAVHGVYCVVVVCLRTSCGCFY